MPRLTGEHLKTQYLKVKELNKALARKNRSLIKSKENLNKRHAHLQKKIKLFQCQKDRLRKQKLWFEFHWRDEYQQHEALKMLCEKNQVVIERYQQHFAVHNY